MKISEKNRSESFKQSQPNFNEQEIRVLQQLNMGHTDARTIYLHTGIYLTSVRRALTDLEQAGHIQQMGKTKDQETGRNVTVYKPLKDLQLSLL